MYRCYDPKRLGFFLLLDVTVAVLWMLCISIGRSVRPADSIQEGVCLPVIMYHSITESAASDYQITPQQFEADLQYLQLHGYQTISVQELVAYTHGTGTLPEHPIMLTFDDGFYNNLSLALPLLEAYDMCAVVSIVGHYTDVTAEMDPHNSSYSYLTWDDVRQLLASGRIELGNHTYDLHSNTQRAGCSIMYGEDEEVYAAMLRADIGQLQSQAQEKTGIAPTVFAYPYGFICRESIPVLKDLGFVCTLTCYERPNYITRDPSCLYGLDRYNRSAAADTEEFFARVLEMP